MKILISVDMEGISGVVADDQVSRNGQDYQIAREIMTQEANYAIEGAFEGGAREVLVNDSHGTMRNLLINKLHPQAKLISGGTKELSMVQGLQEGVDGLFFVGYHAKRGTTQAILDHTYSGRSVWRLSINGQEMGETALNAFVAGAFDVPVLLVTGDDKLCKEAEEMLDKVVTAQVKKAYSRYSALCLSPQEAGVLIKAKAKAAMGNINNVKPYKLKPPYRMELEFISAAMTESPLLIPGSERKNPTTVVYTADDVLTVFKVFRAMLSLA